MRKPVLMILFWVMAFVALPCFALAGESVVIGVSTSLTFLEGKESMKAVEMAVDEINKAGGVKVGSKTLFMTIESIDIRDAAKGVPVPEALLGMEKLILEKKPTALVVGPFRSEALLASMELLAKHKVPLLGSIAMTPKTEGMIAKNPKYKYIFRTCLNAKFFVGYIKGVMAHLQKEYGLKKVFIMNQDVAWARATANIMAKIYGKMGWEVLGHETFPIGATDFSSALLKAKMKKAQVILPVFDMPTSGILVKQWRSMRVPALMVGFISPLAGPAAWKAFDAKIGGAVNSIFELGNVPSAKYPPAKAFFEAYKKKYGKPIEAGHGPAPSYASVYLLKAAIEKAGSLNPEAIVKALKSVEMATPLGLIKFTDGQQAVFGNDPKTSALGCFIQWNDKGQRVIVYPPSIAEGKIMLPSWMKKAK